MRSRLFILLGAAFLSLGVAGSSQANLLTNGNFDTGVNAPVPPPGYATLAAGSTDLTGWTVLNGGIDWIHNDFWQSQSGLRSLDLTALSAGGVSQTVATTAGTQYTLSFWMSINPNLAHQGFRAVDVVATNTGNNAVISSTNFAINRGTRTNLDMQWVKQTVVFTATGSSTTVSFLAGFNGNDAGGVALDNVSLDAPIVNTPVPAPAGVVLAGIGMAVMGLRRRYLAAA